MIQVIQACESSGQSSEGDCVIQDCDTSNSQSSEGDCDTSNSQSSVGDCDTSNSQSSEGDCDTSNSQSSEDDYDRSNSHLLRVTVIQVIASLG